MIISSRNRRRGRDARRCVARAALVSCALLGMVAGCRSPSFTTGINAQQEDKVGQWASAELAGQYPDPPADVPATRVAQISSRLLRAMDAAQATSIHVTLLQEDLPEAFSLPGGWVYVTTGLAARLRRDDALAAVIAHEIAHAALHHASQELVATLGKDTVVNMLTQGKYDDLANICLQLTQLSHSHKEEQEADDFGVALTARAQYAPQGLVDAISALRTNAPQSGLWARVHPMDKARMERLDKAFPAVSLRRGTDPSETN